MVKLLLLFSTVFFVSCGYVGHIKQDDASLEKAVAELNPLKEEIFIFLFKNNSLPKGLIDLPENEKFELRTDKEGKVTYYLKGESDALEGYKISYFKNKEKGFTLKVWGIREFIHLGNLFECFRWLEYNSDQEYPLFPEYRVDKWLGEWALLNYCKA